MSQINLTPEQIKELAWPDVFARRLLGMDLYPKQADVLRAIGPAGSRVAFKSCNEGGKTSRVITASVLWHLFCFPKGVVKSTSGSWNQITSQLVPKLKSYAHKFPRWRFLDTEIKTERSEGFWMGISTDDPGRFEGAHEDDDSPLLIIADEAKSVKDGIFEAIERCRPTRLLLASSTGVPEGEFYRAFTTRAKYYSKLVSQVVTECPHITKEHIDRTTEKWGGREADLIKSMFWAEFMTASDTLVISLAHLERLFASPPSYIPKPERKGACDFAAGGDENVFALREGNRVRIVDSWRDRNTMSAVGRFITNFRRENMMAEDIDGDADGLGKPMCDALAEAGWPITEFHGGQAPRFDEHYANLWAELWYTGAKDIEQGAYIMPPDDDLRGQLMSRRRKYNSKGKLALESKEEMRSRGVPSPDRADAVLMAMGPLLQRRSRKLVQDQYESIFSQEQEHNTRGGFDAGM